MKYKVGDKVKIMTWKSMEREYGLHNAPTFGYKMIKPPRANEYIYTSMQEEEINKICSNRVLTIRNFEGSLVYESYAMKEIESWHWQDYMIDCLVEGYVEPVPISSRFEILDI